MTFTTLPREVAKILVRLEILEIQIKALEEKSKQDTLDLCAQIDNLKKLINEKG